MQNTDAIKQRLDLVDLIQGYVSLKQVGTNWKARCPFHNEKTASFLVSRDKQIWHCFGCGKGGDHFSFVQEMEGMDFVEALQFLAQRAGVVIERQSRDTTNERTRLFSLLRDAESLYHQLFVKHHGAEHARAYVRERGIDVLMSEKFQIGYAPDVADGVMQLLQKRGYSMDELLQAGLVLKRDRGVGVFDRFRDRLLFPIADHLGRTVGFGGRALVKGQEPKYLNSPQSALYNKSAIVFGLDKAKTAIKDEKAAVIVEGYMDVLASHKAGVVNVVASSGTALTVEQVRLLKRYTNTLIFAFDADAAGTEAAQRAVAIAWEQDMDVRAVVLPHGKDPDELVRTDAAAWPTAVKQNIPFLSYALEVLAKNLSADDIANKKRIAVSYLRLLSLVRDPVEQTHFLQALSKRLNVPESLLRQRIPSTGRTARPPVKQSAAPAKPAKKREDRVAERMLALACQHEGLLHYLLERLDTDAFLETPYHALYNAIVTYYTKNRRFTQEDFLATLGREDPGLAQQANILTLFGTSDLLPTDDATRKRELRDGVSTLKRIHIQRALAVLQKQLSEAERNGATKDALRALVDDVDRLTKELADVQE